ncbi:hypothetical protein EYZ11_008125 [Aspergillus tanneri]|uniref:DUF1203 domain-containing protein n=1 Tax=Aspergillus tanneri TaxID=1220188 RepID=A0A4S3JBN4_9EURO|nr:uncharacterized protein ATNIH1004_002113 [Aspergillus tanneri]KAA8649442.1 hypothetical protein ATNIH1004_002113 [Aspergillus tanneri]THC92405.1 hypothetical protein EYZ11_008125 [Aspergillus tanneri]
MIKFTPLPAPLAVDPAKTVTKTVDAANGFPCRRCLRDGKIGEEILLVSYDPFLGVSPYTGPGPIYVHRDCERYECNGTVADQQRRRLLAVRGYSKDHMLMDFVVTQGSELAEKAEGLFQNKDVGYLHAYYAGPGCFAVRIDRV